MIKTSLFFHPNFRTKASLTIAELIVSDDNFGERNLPASNFTFIASKIQNPKNHAAPQQIHYASLRWKYYGHYILVKLHQKSHF